MILTNFDPFTRRQWSDFLNQLKWLEKYNLSSKDVSNKLKYNKWRTISIDCTECNGKMTLHMVNTGPANQTGDDSNCVWICDKCMETIYSERSIKDEIEVNFV